MTSKIQSLYSSSYQILISLDIRRGGLENGDLSRVSISRNFLLLINSYLSSVSLCYSKFLHFKALNKKFVQSFILSSFFCNLIDGVLNIHLPPTVITFNPIQSKSSYRFSLIIYNNYTTPENHCIGNILPISISRSSPPHPPTALSASAISRSG